jgi:hypothetical protein
MTSNDRQLSALPALTDSDEIEKVQAKRRELSLLVPAMRNPSLPALPFWSFRHDPAVGGIASTG